MTSHLLLEENQRRRSSTTKKRKQRVSHGILLCSLFITVVLFVHKNWHSQSSVTVSTRSREDNDDAFETTRDEHVNVELPTRALFHDTIAKNDTTDTRFFDAFFRKTLSDIQAFDGVKVSKSTLVSIARRSSQKLSVYELKRSAMSAPQAFEWNHIADTSSFWSTNPFHDFVRENIDEISSGVLHNNATNAAYFLVNNYDEPQTVDKNNCTNMDELHKAHPNVAPGFITTQGYYNLPVWSMSKVNGCHGDILFPFPDYFAHLKSHRDDDDERLLTAADNDETASSWMRDRLDIVAFRGSTTGFGDAHTNLRTRIIRMLLNESGFDVGFTKVIQGFQQSSASELFKPNAMTGKDFEKYKYLLDIDGNAHSFNRQVLIDLSRSVMIRVNVFTDWIANGMLDGEFCHDVDARKSNGDVLNGLRDIRRMLMDDVHVAERTAYAYHAVTRWLLRKEIAMAYLKRAFSAYVSAVEFVD